MFFVFNAIIRTIRFNLNKLIYLSHIRRIDPAEFKQSKSRERFIFAYCLKEHRSIPNENRIAKSESPKLGGRTCIDWILILQWMEWRSEQRQEGGPGTFLPDPDQVQGCPVRKGRNFRKRRSSPWGSAADTRAVHANLPFNILNLYGCRILI